MSTLQPNIPRVLNFDTVVPSSQGGPISKSL
jgi:hypothetical protein